MHRQDAEPCRIAALPLGSGRTLMFPAALQPPAPLSRPLLPILAAIAILLVAAACGNGTTAQDFVSTPTTQGAGAQDLEATTTPSSAGTTPTATKNPTPTDEPTAAPTPTVRPAPAETAAEADREALVAFYNATDGENWKWTGNWLSDAPIAYWHGVETDRDGRCHRVETRRKRDERGDTAGVGQPRQPDDAGHRQQPAEGREIPPELGNLANLEELYLNDNQLSGEIPPELGNGSAGLEVLFIEGNQLSGCVPQPLKGQSYLDRGDLPFCGE